LVGACAQMEEQALANKMTAPERANRARKGMRLDESSAQRIPRRRSEAQTVMRAEAKRGRMPNQIAQIRTTIN